MNTEVLFQSRGRISDTGVRDYRYGGFNRQHGPSHCLGTFTGISGMGGSGIWEA
jgi:hypothetical protein